MKTQTRRLSYVWFLSVTILLFAAAVTARAEAGPEPRTSMTSQGQGAQRDRIADPVTSDDELAPLVINGSRSKSTRGGAQKAASAGGSQPGSRTPNVEFWIYDASLDLYSDQDHDGYYSAIDLTLDADTVYSEADVYAVLYLSYEQGPWNEYASTADFTIFGASGDDAYFVDTELASGYFTGQYDILIELFDAFDGTFLADFGPENSSQLANLPIEDAGRDTPQSTTTTIIIDEGGGGSFGLLGLLALFGVAGLARIRTARA